MTSVGIVVFPDAQSLDISGPMDVFAEANRFLLPDEHFSMEIIGMDSKPIRCSNGMQILPDKSFAEAVDAYDILLISGGPDLPDTTFDEAVYSWLRQAAAKAKRYGSICSGAFVLARAGLLNGKTVTTHWNYAEQLASLCETANVQADRLYVLDGELCTSAGVTAGIDLCLHLLAKQRGSEVALNVAKRLVVFMQRAGGQSQFSPYLTPLVEPTSPVAQVQQYVLANPAEDLSVKALAAVANMSMRSFARTFVRDAQMAPAEFVEAARLDAARARLENSGAPLKTVAYQCGFNDADRMRSVFQRRLGVSPQQYRNHFNANEPEPDGEETPSVARVRGTAQASARRS
jgi:transcriptional regulator GlxA family with amidase domain